MIKIDNTDLANYIMFKLDKEDNNFSMDELGQIDEIIINPININGEYEKIPSSEKGPSPPDYGENLAPHCLPFPAKVPGRTAWRGPETAFHGNYHELFHKPT